MKASVRTLRCAARSLPDASVSVTSMHSFGPRALLSLAAAALLASGCDDDGGGAGASMRVATFNAGLIDGYVGYSNERVMPVAERLAMEELDLLCLQEVWESSDWDVIEASTAAALPHRFRPDPMPGTGVGVACGPGELDTVATCAATNCPGLEGAELVDCALAVSDGCALEFLALGTDCQACLIANITEGSVEGFREACEAEGTGGRDVFSSGGSFGTALLSAHPLSGTEHHVFEATAVRRGVIYARATGTPLGDVHVFCTHLTPDFGILPFLNPDPAYAASGWVEENALQVADLIAFIESKATDGAPVILLGDLNAGPEVANTGVVAEMPENYAMLGAAGLDSEFLQHGSGECTFCSTNELTGPDTDDVIIDHVLTRNLTNVPTTAELFMTEPVELAVMSGTVTSHYSDHYGVLVTFGP